MYSSFVFAVTIFPGYRTQEGMITQLEQTKPNWDAILGWAKAWVDAYNNEHPENRQRIDGIVVKMAAFAAPEDFTPDISPEQLARLRAANPELAAVLGPPGQVVPAANAPVGTGVPAGYLQVKTPEGWQLVKDPNWKAADPVAELKAQAEAAATAPAQTATPVPVIENTPPRILKPGDIPSPVEGKVMQIPQGAPMPAAPAGGGAATGAMSSFINTPALSPEAAMAHKAEQAAQLEEAARQAGLKK